ncbi:YobI family P-loop NTPase [Dermabacteraceae bacterium P13136]
MNYSSEEVDENPQWDLMPLTPEFIEAEHGCYVRALETALQNAQILNIALSGNYGVGKSSILQELGKRLGNRVVELSLSTLVPVETSKINESVPVQATTQNNQIQQEIVKQLLYREKPSKTPASRFRRLEQFQWLRECAVATLIGAAASIVFLLAGWTERLAATYTGVGEVGVWSHLIICVAVGAMLLIMRRLLYGKFSIKQLSAGSATVTLDDGSVSYFDQYLDEIVYFFEASGCDVVIIEDIDRFNNSHIFDALRALNSLLNASPQVKKPVRFIYAIKDSIFDCLALEDERLEVGGAAGKSSFKAGDSSGAFGAEIVRANRTKFFDLVIPVVPFITHRSARNLAAQLLKRMENKVEQKLLDLAAQHVPDMRLLKNICNEFTVFRDRIFSGDGEKLELSETELFAMMLYKNTNLVDFEKICIGNSDLDSLYKVSRKLVAENIKRLEDEIRELGGRAIRKANIESHSVKLGDQLITHIERTAASAYPGREVERTGWAWSIDDNASISFSDIRTPEFWSTFVAADNEPELYVPILRNYLTFSRSQLAESLGDPLDMEIWNDVYKESAELQINKNRSDIEFLRGADFKGLVTRPEFLVAYGGGRESLASVAKKILKTDIAYRLVCAGYVSRNFTLYTSTFHGDRVSSVATNFIIHHVEQGLMDEYFELDADDVDAVIREVGQDRLGESALYNVAILDRILEKDSGLANIMIDSLATLEEKQTRFLQSYLTLGKHRYRFIEFFVDRCARVLCYLVSQVELGDETRLRMVDTALSCVSAVKQQITLEVADYLRVNYCNFTALTSSGVNLSEAEHVCDIFLDANVSVSSLELIWEPVRPLLVLRNLYEITLENLKIAMRGADDVPLDAMRLKDDAVYKYILENMDDYLKAIGDDFFTVGSCEGFSYVLEDVLERQDSCLTEVIKRAAPACQVVDLDGVNVRVWPALADSKRFPATFENVWLYVDALGLDSPLASLLAAAGEIVGIEGSESEERCALAIKILSASEQIPDPRLRVNLVASLKLDDYLDVGEINAEAGVLFSLLLKQKIISDSEESFAHLMTSDWSTRRAFICESKEFPNYITPELVQQDLAELLGDDGISDEIKAVILEDVDVYSEHADLQGVEQIAMLAIRGGSPIPFDILERMVQKGVSACHVLPLLKPHLGTLKDVDLFSMLKGIGDGYERLATVGKSVVQIDDTIENRALLDSLKWRGIVSSYRENGPLLRVYRRRKNTL